MFNIFKESIKVIAFFIIAGFLVFQGTAEANDSWENWKWKLRMGDEGSMAIRHEFNQDEVPYAHLYISNDYLGSTPSSISAFWQWKKDDIEMDNATTLLTWSNFLDINGNFNYWMASDKWPDIAAVGDDWAAKVTWTAYIDGVWGMKEYKNAASFTVTPEPVSSILFLAGGAFLAAIRRRKKILR